MRISRFYLPLQYQQGATLPLNKQQSHYALTVLRLKDKRAIEIFDGKGNQAEATLIHTGRRSADVVINHISNPDTESPLHTVLLQAISKGDRMDYTIQKCVELGITEIQPILTEHCDSKLTPQKLTKLQTHWQNIAISACEQSNRNTIPAIHSAEIYSDWLSNNANSKGIVLNPYANSGLNELATTLKEQPIHLLIGAEGGLTSKEVQQAISHGFSDIQLGKRILRTETAGVAVLSALQLLWGDF